MDHIFEDLTLIIVLAVAISFIMRLLKQPLMIGHIITGVLVGPAVLNLVNGAETIEIFAEFGIALLLFIIGLGLSLRVFKDVGKVAILASLAQVIFVGGAAYVVATLFGYPHLVSLLIAIALSLSSTIIVLKLLSDLKEQSRLYAKVSIGFLLIQDLLATLAVVFVSSSASGSITLDDFIPLASKAGLVIAGLVVARYAILPHLNATIAKSQEFLFLFSIGWAIGIATLFQSIGFSLEIGALIAGITLASMPFAPEAASRLKPLRDFFIVLHFVILGSLLEIGVVQHSLWQALALAAVVLILNPFSVLLIMGLMGYTKRTSFKAGLAMTQVGEFSLILLAVANRYGYIDAQVVSMVTFVALLTIGVSTYAIIYSDQVYRFFERYLRLFERRKAKDEHHRRKRYDLVLFGYQRGGHEFLPVFRKLSNKYVVVDYDPHVVDFLEQRDIEYIYGDASDPDMLEEINLMHSKLVVSTITDLNTNLLLANWLDKNNASAVFIATADNAEEAARLYELGTSYVMLPHYIGSEKIGSFIKRSGLKKAEFRHFREQHLNYLQSHHELFGTASTDA